jgi:serine/threonine-protein kinase ATR
MSLRLRIDPMILRLRSICSLVSESLDSTVGFGIVADEPPLICISDAILNYVDGFHTSKSVSQAIMPFAAEAAWSTGKWDQLEKALSLPVEQLTGTSLEFNMGIGKALLALRKSRYDEFEQTIESLREAVAKSLSPTATASLHAAHEHMLKLHTLYELETISGVPKERNVLRNVDRELILENLDRRLDILGVNVSDKQYLLGVRRAAMQLSRSVPTVYGNGLLRM